MERGLPRTRVVVAESNLRGFRGLTLDAYGALLDGGPMEVPAALWRLLRETGSAPVSPTLEELWRNAFRDHVRTEPFITFREVLRRSALEVLERFGVGANADDYVDEILAGYRSAKVYPEVPSVLRELEREIALGVIANMDTKLLLEALRDNALTFTYVITSDEEQRYKPSPALFRRAVRYFGLPASHILHVGSSYEDDFRGAAAVGMASALIRRRGNTEDLPRDVQRVVHNLGEVRDLIRRSWQED